MATKAVHEGYLLIDHRASPGVRTVPEGAIFESATITCSHCQRVIVLNRDRTRERAWCRKCDHYVCDGCASAAALGECRPFAQVIDEHIDQAYHEQVSYNTYPLILPTGHSN